MKKPLFIFALLLTAVVGHQAEAKKLKAKPQLYAQNSQAYDSDSSTSNSMKYGRPPEASFYTLEPVIGVTSSSFAGIEFKDSNGKVDSLPGYEAGMSVLMGREALQFETGLFYAQRGAKYTFTGIFSDTSISIQANYIEVPLMARYALQNPRENHLFVKGGAVVGVIQSSTAKATGSTTLNDSSSNTVDTKDSFNSTDVRAAVGFGGKVFINKSTFWVLQLDYQYGLTKANKTGDISAYNSSAGVTTGVAFGI